MNYKDLQKVELTKRIKSEISDQVTIEMITSVLNHLDKHNHLGKDFELYATNDPKEFAEKFLTSVHIGSTIEDNWWKELKDAGIWGEKTVDDINILYNSSDSEIIVGKKVQLTTWWMSNSNNKREPRSEVINKTIEPDFNLNSNIVLLMDKILYNTKLDSRKHISSKIIFYFGQNVIVNDDDKAIAYILKAAKKNDTEN